MLDEEIVRPLDLCVDASGDHRLVGGDRNRPRHDLKVIIDRRPEAKHQLPRTVVLPGPIEPAPTG